VALPVRETRKGKKSRASKSQSSSSSPAKVKQAQEDSEDDDDDDDDKPLVTPTTGRKRRLVVDESDEDDQPVVSSPIKRRRLTRRNNESSPARDADDNEDEAPAPSSARVTRPRRKPLTQKEKARELLRRKRAGEVVNEDHDSLFSEDEEPEKAMYDTDSDHLALNEFEDDEEGVLEPNQDAKKKKESKKKKKKQKAVDDDDESESIDDFIVDDSDAPLGVPEEVYQNMPLEFTAHSHKPLKEHFRDAIEWLVQFKINPGFAEKEHPLYRMAWKKLDDEVRGLATSKFASAAWKKDFYMALRARPYFTNGELPKGDLLEAQSCGACGRSGHPAR
jgi:hypothetical protein